MTNVFCCKFQSADTGPIECKFKNCKAKIAYGLTNALLQKSTRSCQPQKNWEEVAFASQLFCESSSKDCHYKWIDVHCYFVQKKHYSEKYNANKVVVLHLINKAKRSPLTLLVSHDHLSTIGNVYPLLLDISTQLKCDVVSYDYSGYGLSTGQASEREAITDLEAVSSFLLASFKLNEELILLSIGLGAVPTLSLASQVNSQSIKAVVLLSPILQSKTINRLEENVNCPVLLIHGQANQVVNYSLTQAFAKLLKTIDEWYPSNGTYSNITSRYRVKLYSRIKEFLSFIQIIHPRSHYLTTPLFSLKMNANTSKDKYTSDLKPNLNKKKDNDYLNRLASSCMSSSSFDSSNGDNLFFKGEKEELIDVNGINNWETEGDEDNHLTVHRKESNMILNTIRSFNVK